MSLFIVVRDGVYNPRVPPCEGAVSRPGKYLDRRIFETEEDHDARFPHDPWRGRGFGHSSWVNGEKAGIQRFFETSEWVVEIDDFAAFVRREGEVQVSPPVDGTEECSIRLGGN